MPRDVLPEDVVARPYDGPPHLSPPASEITDDVLRCLIEGRANIMDPARWCQHVMHSPSGRSCAIGAMFPRLGRWTSTISSAVETLNAVLPHECPKASDSGKHPVAFFNDDPTTTHADVLALFDRAVASRRADLGM